MYRLLVLILPVVLFIPTTGFAQDVDGSIPRPDRIETDRDSFTPSARLVGPKRMIVESAYTFQDNRNIDETHSFPELLLRYGLCKRIELRLGWNYEVGGAGNVTTGADADVDDETEAEGLLRENRISYGIKVLLTEFDGLIPESSFILQGFTPMSGPETATELVATATWGWEFFGNSKLDMAMRYGTNSEEGDHFNTWAPSIVWKTEVFERWMVHVEYFGIFSANRERNFNKQFISPGIHYLVTDNLEIGTRVGWGLNDQSSRFFCNVGLGVRF